VMADRPTRRTLHIVIPANIFNRLNSLFQIRIRTQ